MKLDLSPLTVDTIGVALQLQMQATASALNEVQAAAKAWNAVENAAQPNGVKQPVE
jgi:hypothetical protein